MINTGITLSQLGSYIIDPGKIGIDVWNGIYNNCYFVCLGIATIAFAMYICGFKGCKKYIIFSFVIYSLIRMIGKV